MNKKILLLGFTATLVLFSACKKDYKCVCSENGTEYTFFEYQKVKKEAAQTFCAADEAIQQQEVSSGVSCVVEEK